jgi:hypothetical protein
MCEYNFWCKETANICERSVDSHCGKTQSECKEYCKPTGCKIPEEKACNCDCEEDCTGCYVCKNKVCSEGKWYKSMTLDSSWDDKNPRLLYESAYVGCCNNDDCLDWYCYYLEENGGWMCAISCNQQCLTLDPSDPLFYTCDITLFTGPSPGYVYESESDCLEDCPIWYDKKCKK